MSSNEYYFSALNFNTIDFCFMKCSIFELEYDLILCMSEELSSQDITIPVRCDQLQWLLCEAINVHCFVDFYWNRICAFKSTIIELFDMFLLVKRSKHS